MYVDVIFSQWQLHTIYFHLIVKLPTRAFLKVKQGQRNVAVRCDSVTDHLLSFLTEGGSRQIASERRRLLCVIPIGSIHTLLTQEWMTRVNNSKVCLVSSLTICQVHCGHDASWRAEAYMDPQLGCYCALASENTRSGASFRERSYNRFD